MKKIFIAFKTTYISYVFEAINKFEFRLILTFFKGCESEKEFCY